MVLISLDVGLISSIAVALGAIVAALVIARYGNRAVQLSEENCERILKQPGPGPRDEGDIGISMLSRRMHYHDQALNQAGVQFWFGIAATSLGFLLIISNGVFASSHSLPERLVPGGIISSVAALFLKQSAETRRRATEFYDRLQGYEAQRESLKLVSTMSETRVQSVAQALLALHIAGAPIRDAVKLFALKTSGKEKREVPMTKTDDAGRLNPGSRKKPELVEEVSKEGLAKN
jgi:hypothetical protein